MNLEGINLMRTGDITTSDQFPLVSIVVPIYNVAEFLAPALQSISEQTYSNLEILLIDDGSTDGSYAIAEKFAVSDKRVTVHVKPNGGLSDARNYGLERASGEYIYFLDSDDIIKADTIETCVTRLQKLDADMVVFDYQQIDENGQLVTSDYGHGLIYQNNDVVTSSLALQGVFNFELVITAWSYMAKRELFMEYNIRFSKGRLHEDVNNTPKLMYYANKIAIINEPFYQYRIRNGSIASKKREKNLIDLMWVINDLQSFFTLNYITPEVDNDFNKFIIGNLQGYMFYLGGSYAKANPEIRKQFFDMLKNAMQKIKVKQLSRKTKLKITLAKSVMLTNLINLKRHDKF